MNPLQANIQVYLALGATDMRRSQVGASWGARAGYPASARAVTTRSRKATLKASPCRRVRDHNSEGRLA